MKSLKNKIWLGVLVILIFILFLQHLNGNNLDKFRVLDRQLWNSILFYASHITSVLSFM